MRDEKQSDGRDASSSSPSASIRAAAAARAPLVLLADDSAVARLTVARRLRAEGLRVVEGSTADAALEELDGGGSIACALLDLELGDGDGSEVAARLRRERPHLPIAFFSADPSAGVVARARTFGPVFAKPHQLDDAVAWVKTHAY